MIPGSGILLVDKPAGVTSFAVVNHVRKALIRTFPSLNPPRNKGKGGHRPPRFKCGHAGTLDPLATGLLLVMVGRGSRISQFLLGLDKTYQATVRFGIATDTLDREGTITAQEDVSLSSDKISDVLPHFFGEIDQIPPLISALKVDGKAMYKRVRSGEVVPEPNARSVTINELILQDTRWGIVSSTGLIPADGKVYEADFKVGCGSGTYIRSLARDIAAKAGTLGHIHELRRLDVGPFHVKDAIKDIMNLDGNTIAESLHPLANALPHIPRLTLNGDEAAAVGNGHQPEEAWLSRLDKEPAVVGKAGQIFRMLDEAGELLAVGVVDQESGLPRMALVIPQEIPSPGIDVERKPLCD